MTHRDVMVRLAGEHRWRRGVEVGVGSGGLLGRLLEAGIEMVGVDIGTNAARLARQRTIAAAYPDRCRLITLPSLQAAEHVEDGWADFIFIDAAHSYEAVMADIVAWSPKVKPGGWLGGHDFHPKWPGVARAVKESFAYDLLDGWVWVRRQ